jgi:hypothetical protein
MSGHVSKHSIVSSSTQEAVSMSDSQAYGPFTLLETLLMDLERSVEEANKLRLYRGSVVTIESIKEKKRNLKRDAPTKKGKVGRPQKIRKNDDI